MLERLWSIYADTASGIDTESQEFCLGHHGYVDTPFSPGLCFNDDLTSQTRQAYVQVNTVDKEDNCHS